jgi:hypothetical protein
MLEAYPRPTERDESLDRSFGNFGRELTMRFLCAIGKKSFGNGDIAGDDRARMVIDRLIELRKFGMTFDH